jgi:hypothetical protein
MKIKIYYGLSGALKGSTIKAEKEKDPGIKVMESSIKPWKYYQFGLYKDRTEYNDLTYGILHLVRLREFMENNHQEESLVIERGVTDSLFYYYYNSEFSSGEGKSEEPSFINDVVRAERSLLLPDFTKIERILMIQNDKDFIRDVVLEDEYRKKTFNNNPELYLSLQEKYIKFTTKYNAIDQVVRIDNAKDYIEQTLRISYNF